VEAVTWVRTVTRGGPLHRRYQFIGFHKMKEMCWGCARTVGLTGSLPCSQEPPQVHIQPITCSFKVHFNILTCLATRQGVYVGNWIYRTTGHCNSVTDPCTLPAGVALPYRFLTFRTHVLTGWRLLSNGVGVGVLLAADSQSTSTSGYRASLWDPWPDFILLVFFSLTITSLCYQCVLSDEKTGL
jgi:hypothetical protein